MTVVHDEEDLRLDALIDHWMLQGVTHFAIADLSPGADAPRPAAREHPGATVVVGRGPRADWHDTLNALARRARRAGADWIVIACPDERGFAESATVAEALSTSNADVVDVPVHDAFASGRGWLVDRSRGPEGRVAFRTHRLAWIGPGASSVDRPGVRETTPSLNLVRSAPRGARPRGPTVTVDLDSWTTWDPAGQLTGPTLIRSAQVPGAGAPLRRRPRLSNRTVIVPPPWMGFGNLLYLLLAAHTRRRAGQDCVVLSTPTAARWSASLGTLGDLVLEPGDLRRRDQREDPLQRTYGAFGLDFTADELGDFVRHRLLASPGLEADRREPETRSSPGRLTLNIRRGDYYSVPEFQLTYGFDQVAYVRAALAAAEERAPVDEVRIVSDGPEWCRSRLGWLAEDHDLVVTPPEDTPLANFVDVAASRRLAITNSTFSYWAAHVSNELHGDNHADTVAPWFFSRAEAGGRAYQVDPRWQIVDDLPAGWNGSLGESE